MALAIHELTTNSIKFGALSGNGRLNLAWAVTDAPGATILDLEWSESGVAPLVPAPRLRGFGRQFIEEALPYQLGAETSFALKPGGLECSVSLPLSGLLAKEVTSVARRSKTCSPAKRNNHEYLTGIPATSPVATRLYAPT